jgi:hypothetical protein
MEAMKAISRRDTISGIAATSAGLALTFSRNALSASPNEAAKGDACAAAAKYVDAFLQNVNWEEVNRRTEALPKT